MKREERRFQEASFFTTDGSPLGTIQAALQRGRSSKLGRTIYRNMFAQCAQLKINQPALHRLSGHLNTIDQRSSLIVVQLSK